MINLTIHYRGLSELVGTVPDLATLKRIAPYIERLTNVEFYLVETWDV